MKTISCLVYAMALTMFSGYTYAITAQEVCSSPSDKLFGTPWLCEDIARRANARAARDDETRRTKAAKDEMTRRTIAAREEETRQANKQFTEESNRAFTLWFAVHGKRCPGVSGRQEAYNGLSLQLIKDDCMDEAKLSEIAATKPNKTFTRSLNEKLGDLFK